MEKFNTDNPISARTAQAIERLSQPKAMYSLTDENIILGGDFYDDPPIIRRAKIYRATLEVLKQPVYPNELIIGDVPYHEFKDNRELMPLFLTSKEREAIDSEAKAEYRTLTGTDPENFKEMQNFFTGGICYGHIIADYGIILKIGFKGMKARVDESIASVTDKDKRDFLLAVKIVLEAGSEYILRYAETSGKVELQSLADNPPETFFQAVQLLWFMQLLLEIESGISAFSYGRADQYLYPFLKADLETGRINIEQAQEIMDCFFVKNNEQNMITIDAGRAVTISGVTSDGTDGVNDVTYLMLNSATRMKMLQPKLNARIHKNSPDEYLCLCAKGASINAGVQIYNDDVILKALENYGYLLTDAVDYGIIGCYEYGLAGIDRPSPMSVTFNLAACFEQALYENTYDSYEGLESSFGKCVAFYAEKVRLKMIWEELTYRRNHPLPFLSAFVGDCIKRAADINSGGARYTTCGVRFTGFSAVTDSLTAVKTLVFDNGNTSVDLLRLIKALKNNFEGEDTLRQVLLSKAPKYGNDDDVADTIAVRVGEICCGEILKQTHIYGAKLRPGLFSFLNFMDAGRKCGALPNGRKAGEPFVNGVSPMHGMDLNGPTAMLASAAKLNYMISPNGTTLDLKLPPPVSFEQLSHLTRAYFDMGGAHIQAYTLSPAELEAAKEEPEKYAGIIVRVTGYSAYFTKLDTTLQNEIIKRTTSFQV